jgi:beta-lactam-binding protein with PASTA domain
MKLVALFAGMSLVLVAPACGAARGPAVPDVRGKNLPDAAVALYERHLCVRAVNGPTLRLRTARQTVVAQSPSPGTRARSWSLVTLTVRSYGPPGAHASNSIDFVWGGPKPPCPPIRSK